MITLKTQVTQLVSDLQTWATATWVGTTPTVEAFPHLKAAWDQVYRQEGNANFLVVWDSETSRTSYPGSENLGIVDREFSVIVRMGRGLSVDRGDSLTEGAGGGPALLDVVDQTVDFCRSLRLGEELSGNYYKGVNLFGTEFGMLSDAYRIRFGVGSMRQIFQFV